MKIVPINLEIFSFLFFSAHTIQPDCLSPSKRADTIVANLQCITTKQKKKKKLHRQLLTVPDTSAYHEWHIKRTSCDLYPESIYR